MTTFSYRLDGRVTIDDDVNWPYSTALRNGDPDEITRYEARFCSEVRVMYMYMYMYRGIDKRDCTNVDL